jgi:hypothetical protein
LNNFFITNFEDKQQYSGYNFIQHLNYKIYYNDNCKLYLEENLVILFIGIKFDEKNILELYKQHGDKVFKEIEGEYSIIIFDKNKILLGSDIFGTRPLYFYKHIDNISISDSYCVLKKSYRVYENTYFIFNNNNIYINEAHVFDLEEKKDNINDWENALYKSIQKRIKVKPSLMLSDGIDSGAIACAFLNKSINFSAFSLLHSDNYNNELFERRCTLHNCTFINENELKDSIAFNYNSVATKFNQRLDSFHEVDYTSKNISIRLMDFIKEKSEHLIISGCGASFTDVNINSLYKRANNVRGFNYDNPILLQNICGLYNKDTRFVLLDKDLIQEMLWLKKDIYNQYKQPAIEFMDKYNYPYYIIEEKDFNKYKTIPRRGLINRNDYI